MAYSLVGNQHHEVPEVSEDAIERHRPYTDTDDCRKSFASVNINEIDTPSTVSKVVSHQRGWSDATAIAPDEAHEKTSSTAGSITKQASFSKSSSWTLEIVTILIGLGAVASIVGVLARFNGRGLPEWPYYITLNALIALLATIANATMTVSLSSGLGQLKWIRFKESRAPLTDMEVFDEASRGTWGAIKLLATARGGLFGSFGAVVAVVALALGPFAQQIATYRIRSVEHSDGAVIPRALNYTGALPGNSSTTGFVPILPLKAAVYNGLFAENGRPAASLPLTCQSGNCTWEPFETLAACYECVSLTPFITRYCAPGFGDGGNISSCGWQVPQGARLNSSQDVFSMTSFIPSAYGDMPHATMIRLIFMGTELQDGEPGQIDPWALQCTLQACVQTVSSTVVNGTLYENITDAKFNSTVVDMTSGAQDYPVHILGQNTEERPYELGMGAMLSIRGWFSSIFTNGSAVRNAEAFTRSITDMDRAVVVNLTVGISSGETFFDSDIVTAFYWNFYQYPDGLPMLMSDLAVSMTTAFRAFFGAVPVNGKSLTLESYVHVRWGFAVLPISVVILTAVFLLLAMYRTRQSKTRLWKSSALAMLFHGLDHDTRAQFGRAGSFDDKKKKAKVVKVRLDESGDSGSLLRA